MAFVSASDRRRKREKEKQYSDAFFPEKLNTWIFNLPDVDYFRLPKYYYSSSGIMQHFSDDDNSSFFEWVKNKTSALQVGTLIHCHLLTPEDLELPAMKALVDECIERFPSSHYKNGKYKPSAMEIVESCVKAALENEEIVQALEGTDRELAAVIDNYHGGYARIKADAIDLNKGILYDVKTSSDTLNNFRKKVLDPYSDSNYYIQAALYLDVANRIHERMGSDVRFNSFKWIYVGKKNATTGIVECPPELIQAGLEKIKEFYASKHIETAELIKLYDTIKAERENG